MMKLCSHRNEMVLFSNMFHKNDNKNATYIVDKRSLFFWSYNRCNGFIICAELNRHGRECCLSISCCTLEENQAGPGNNIKWNHDDPTFHFLWWKLWKELMEVQVSVMSGIKEVLLTSHF